MSRLASANNGPVEDQQRLTELLMAISLAADLVAGQPFGQTLRASYLSASLAAQLGCTPDETRDTLQVSLLYFIGCTADADETAARSGGDEQAFNAQMAPAVMGSDLEVMSSFFRAIGAGHSLFSRLRLLGGTLADPDGPARSLASHCDVAAMLARRLGLRRPVITALAHAYERWDGKGYPAGLRGEAIPLPVRIAIVACDSDLFTRLGYDADRVLVKRARHAYDPDVVSAYCRIGSDVLSEFDSGDGWKNVLNCEPDPQVVIPAERIDDVLTVIADFVDIKSPWSRGHSREVARFAESAGTELGMSAADCLLLKQSGLVHDIGRVGVPNGILDKPGPLNMDEWERIRLHPYLTHRVLSRCSALRPLAEIAASHHERLDGSGYHRNYSASQLPMPARILAAADVFAAVRSDRPYRPAMTLTPATDLLEDEVRAGRLDANAVSAVLSCEGVESKAGQQDWPSDLTEREVQVLRLISRGQTNRQVASKLYISSKTVDRHVQNIYMKTGVSTCAGAAVFAMQHGLLD
jgi:HD-GYP domain-containing protein (c-di-GMP phosphodiesterase class II)/DNA-binding CsgD family transcriptional regulator